MSDRDVQAQGHRRANWVALRTLRLRPTPAGTTEHGEPVFEIRSVRLVLREGAGHFKRLVACSKCGREIVGSPLLAPDDLERTPSPVICERCVKGSSLEAPWPPDPPAEPLQARLEVLEDQLRRTLPDVARALEIHRQEVGVVADAVARLQGEVAALAGSVATGDGRFMDLEQRLLAALDRLHARLDRPPALVSGPSSGDTLDDQLRAAERRLAARTGRPTIDVLIEPPERR